MISVRYSPAAKPNAGLRLLRAKPGENNRAWLTRARITEGVVLIGGAALADFRIRMAQSHVRHDMLPSFWSRAGLLHGRRIDMVCLDGAGDVSEVPGTNGVRSVDVDAFADPDEFPNIAVITVGLDRETIARHVRRVKGQRGVIDLPRLMIPWLSYVWGAGQNASPLLEGLGVPSAAFVETVYALAGIELTPGLSSQSTCPEAIWQTAKWWQAYYASTAEHATHGPLEGCFTIRQTAAAVREPKRRS